MNAIKIERHLDSETLHLPELRGLLGRDVEITVIEKTHARKSDLSKRFELAGRNKGEE